MVRGAGRDSQTGGGCQRVLIISSNEVNEEMFGPAIRVLEFARALRTVAEVTVISPGSSESREADGIRFLTYEPSRLRVLKREIKQADVVITQPVQQTVARWLKRSKARIVFDIYDPVTFEILAFPTHLDRLRRAVWIALSLDHLDSALRYGHHFICASEKQRDLWIGTMLAKRLIAPELFDRDPALSSTTSVIPFGLPAEKPAKTGAGPRELIDGIAAEDELVLWNGGIWSWLDADTAVRAVKLLVDKRPNLRLVFMGRSEMLQSKEPTERARALAQELGLLDVNVFFNNHWVPYAERANWLLEADCAISTHLNHLETRFAFRTRLLDCFWAGLPIVCTEGDALADRVRDSNLGLAVSEADPQALADALDAVLANGRDSYSQQLMQVAAEFQWEQITKPLTNWIEHEKQSQALGRSRRFALRPVVALRSRVYRLWENLSRFLSRMRS